MFHIVNRANRSRYALQLQDMHRLRYAVFEGRPHGGPDAAAAGLGERDRFDDDQALYLMRLDSFGEIVCCARLRPTHENSLIGSYYPQAIAAGEAPVDAPGVWEFSHYYARDSTWRPSGDRLRAEMRLAVLAAALDAGVSRVLITTEVERARRVLESGWNVRPLGLPFTYGEGAQAISFVISVQVEDLAAFRHKLDEELQASVGNDSALGNLSGLADRLGPAALNVVNGLSRRIALVEENEGTEAALALAEGLERALRMETSS